MAVWSVARDYRATLDGRVLTLVEGAQVELDDDLAAWINRDSPGCIRPTPDRRTERHVDGPPRDRARKRPRGAR